MKKKWDYILLILIVIIIVPSVFFYKELATILFPTDENKIGELVKLLLSILGGIGIFYGLIISNRRAKSTDDSVKKQGEQIELSRKSQIDERFKNAIEHLGSEKEPIILGGIAELHQIAKEDKEKYSEVVFHILNSYIRTETDIYNKTAKDIKSTVVRTIINYLFKIYNGNPYSGLKADLCNSNLCGQDIELCNFENAKLSFCLLGTVKDCILDGADISKAEIQSSFFENNSLCGIKLFHAQFQFVEFVNTIFRSEKHNSLSQDDIFAATFINCKFVNVAFDDLSIYDATFIGCIFDNCTFERTSLLNNRFFVSNICNVDFSNTNHFSQNDFRGTNFNNVLFNNFVMECRFNGCKLGNKENTFILIEEELQKCIESTIKLDSSSLKIGYNKDCDFNFFTTNDLQEILGLYSELRETKKLPREGK